MDTKPISKADIKLADSCLSKFYLKRSGFDVKPDNNEFLSFLAEGGHVIGKIGQLYYPDAVLIENDGDGSTTKKLLEKESIDLFEASFHVENLRCQVDVLLKTGNELHIIEVKSKGISPSDPNPLKKGWNEYITDITFQKLVVQKAYPNFKIHCYFLVPNKEKRTTINGLPGLFITLENDDFLPDIDFIGNQHELIEDQLLYQINVDDIVEKALPFVNSQITLCKEILKGKVKPDIKFGKKCFGCEFKLDSPKDGFSHCWKGREIPKENAMDLYQIGKLSKKTLDMDEAIHQGKFSWNDLPHESFEGVFGLRREVQINQTRLNEEFISEELKNEINTWKYPLHFIDFEASTGAIPIIEGMKPYEQLVFQWSCHSILQPGGPLVHSEWLNTEITNPPLPFIESLLDVIDTDGTILIYSSYENTSLRNIYHHFEQSGWENPRIKTWLEKNVKFEEKDEHGFVDLLTLCKKHYFHPKMGKSNSIKAVLPAVLSAAKGESLKRIKSWLENFDKDVNLFCLKPNGEIENPYNLLPKVELLDTFMYLKEGTAAIRAYEKLLFHIETGSNEWIELVSAMKRYCKLDTLAMVIIWDHWRKK
jgi:hypothetical protein